MPYSALDPAPRAGRSERRRGQLADRAARLGGAPRLARANDMLSVSEVSKSYGERRALAGVSLHVEAGEILGLLGQNGAGKTTLVSIVAGLRRPDGGRVTVDGIDVFRSPQRARRLIGLAPQDTGVYLPLTVRDNLRY